ncbi:MAG: SGNH/GDSL hydrolase family protein [Pseudomonadota bacterium]|nr:SGNH/GDSL hydrolase family protein [Pseudomonadota bacterium]
MNIIQLRAGILILLLQLILPGFAAAGSDAKGLVVFGDSLSDTGNKFYITGFANAPPYSELLDFFLVADGPYTRGGLHHSNGATWIEQYARPLGQGGHVRPALRSQGKASNYAYGGARARLGLVIIPNSNQQLPAQVDTFLADVNHSAPADSRYVLFIGANDIFDAVVALTSDPSGATSALVIEKAVESVATEIGKLSAAGALNFVVLNAPDLGLTPAIKLIDAMFSPVPGALVMAATSFSMAYNAGLNTALGPTPGVEIIDIFTEFRKLIENPQDFGLSNSEDACVTPEQPPYSCRNPDSYVFWDGVHPTKVAHGIIADVVAETLAN